MKNGPASVKREIRKPCRELPAAPEGAHKEGLKQSFRKQALRGWPNSRPGKRRFPEWGYG